MGNAQIAAPVRITVQEFAEREGVAVSTARLWITKGIAPRSYMLGTGRRVMDLDDVINWEHDIKAGAR